MTNWLISAIKYGQYLPEEVMKQKVEELRKILEEHPEIMEAELEAKKAGYGITEETLKGL